MFALETFHLEKRFPGVVALNDFSLAVQKGEVHALVGENGAGKSTLIKILSGVYKPTAGNFRIGGKPMSFSSPRDAVPFVGVVHQDRELVPHFSGYENLFLGMERTAMGFLQKKRMKREAFDFMMQYGLDFDPELPAEKLSGGQQQMLAILRILFRNPEIVIFDEPTAPLSVKECDSLFSLIRDLRIKGVTILYISHHLSEVLRLSDRVTVMHNGTKVATKEISESDEASLIRLMLSHDVVNQYPKAAIHPGAEVFRMNMKKESSSRARTGKDGFYIRSGEIVGFAGLVGAGRTELAKAVFSGFGNDGTLELDGKSFRSRNARESIDKGIVMIPENRREEGLIVDMNVGDNLTLPQLKLWTTLGFVHFPAAKRASRQIVDQYSIKAHGLAQAVKTLSGGNQQKVSIGKWSYTKARLWIFDEPTQGIDVDAKTEIYAIMGRLAAQGAGIWFISSEIRELLAIADRIYVMKDKRIVAEHLPPYDNEAILSDMLRDPGGFDPEAGRKS
ncbi:sugar ABC transporter ATP-binding protein [Fretibacterium sp. OH1220_COT-178]|uniref:sugar ABC transporter ATP-binding protein n=1 Tax=Fretibacterium sp. OH1220_COT-178 TaxID=2491047 RepID=UPI000F5E205E|nr:sugar ABC transporter ATP-binding protein [Fretibacterium sp. OH1220_COT-178]